VPPTKSSWLASTDLKSSSEGLARASALAHTRPLHYALIRGMRIYRFGANETYKLFICSHACTSSIDHARDSVGQLQEGKIAAHGTGLQVGRDVYRMEP
jgi:hypothetical protein